MALKLLNPGLRPLGQFDLHDGVTLLGGEYVELQSFLSEGAGGAEGFAADVGAMMDAQGNSLAFNISTRTDPAVAGAVLGGLADEGINEYGTLFGQIVGSTAGRGTVFLGAGPGGAVVTPGPQTSVASGKVTVFDKEGLYGVSGAGSAAQLTADQAVPNAAVFSAGGTLTTTDAVGAGNGVVAIYVTAVNDTSLVSTTSRAAGGAATFEYHALYYIGNAAA